MKKLLTIAAILTIGISNAQITIDHNDMPAEGDLFSFSITNTVTGDFENTGENYFWDLSDLSYVTQDVDSFYAVDDTPFLYQFFFNNGFLYPDYEADVALKGDDLEAPVVTISDLYNYYKNDEDGYRLVGIGTTVNQLPQSIQYDPIDWIYEFPLAYGDDFSGSSFLEISVPQLGYLSQDKDTETVVDGWGTLSLPIGTYEVLRLKRTINEVDSVYNDAFGIGFLTPRPEVTNYRWLASGEVEPVLDISVMEGQVVEVKYKDEIVDGVDYLSKLDVSVSPNPSKDFIRIAGVDGLMVEDLSVVNASGQVMVCSISKQSDEMVIDISSLAQGVYFIVVEYNENSNAHSFIKY